MNSFESPIYFDALALGVLIGGILLLLGLVWVIVDRREFEDPLRRRERRERERSGRGKGLGGEGDRSVTREGDRGDGEPRPDGGRGRRRVA